MTKETTLSAEYLDKALERMSIATARNLDAALQNQSIVTAKNLDAALQKQSIVTAKNLDKALEKMSIATAKNLDTALNKQATVTAKNLDAALNKQAGTTAKNLDNALKKQSKETAQNLDGALKRQSNETTQNLEVALGVFGKNIDARFDEVISVLVRHDVTLDRHEGILTALVIQVQNMDERLEEVKDRVGKVETAVLDLGDVMALRNEAADADSETLIHHEERIEKLELRFA